MFRKISQSISNLKAELGKCSWPWESDPKVTGFKKYRELWTSTLTVLIAMVLLGGYVAFFDYIMGTVVQTLIDWLA